MMRAREQTASSSSAERGIRVVLRSMLATSLLENGDDIATFHVSHTGVSVASKPPRAHACKQ